jgi:hypothetical protein
MRLCPLPLSTLLLISSELLKPTNFKIMLKIRVHDSSAVTVCDINSTLLFNMEINFSVWKF